MNARRQVRGAGLLEVMATMAVMAFGIVSLAMTVSQTASTTRKNLRVTHGQMVAERVLEDLVQQGCNTLTATSPDPCWDLKQRDDVSREFWVSSEGQMVEGGVVDIAGLNRQRYHVATDVDPPFEGNETGAPVIQRVLAAGAAGNVVNVRVTVSWQEPSKAYLNVFQTAVLQTRISPSEAPR